MKEKKEPIMVTRSFMPPFEEYTELLKDLWESAWLTNMGRYHEEFKAKLKKYSGCGNLELFVNGHTALEMGLQALSLSGEVITTPFTFASTTHAIVRNGLTPVFADIKRSDYTIDPESIEKHITEKTSAIVAVHVYGHPCDTAAIKDLADRHGLKVIYDAAHAFGVEKDGTPIGRFGDMSMFSFHATKVFHSIEGGALTFGDAALADVLYKIKNFGITGYESVEYVGGNGKMNEFQAAMGLCNLKYVDENIKKRGLLWKRYKERLSDVPGIRLTEPADGVKPNFSYMPVVFSGNFDRDEVFSRLKANDIFARKYFYPCVNEYDCYRDRFCPDETPVAREIAGKVLTLPLHQDLETEDVDRICDIILGEKR